MTRCFIPFVYALNSKSGAQALENLTTNGTANTENDFAFLKPGASRVSTVLALRIQGKGAGLTALSGIVNRLKHWTSTSSTTVGGTSVTPAPKHNLAPAAVSTAGMATVAAGTITSGTGGPNIVGFAGCGASGPGGWVAANPDDVPSLDGGANKSADLFSSSPTVSLSFEHELDVQEG